MTYAILIRMACLPGRYGMADDYLRVSDEMREPGDPPWPVRLFDSERDAEEHASWAGLDGAFEVEPMDRRRAER